MISYDISNISVAILAGGLGSRLKTLTKKKPKSLIKIDGEPFIIKQLKILQAQGFKKVVICLGHLSEQVKKEIRSYNFDMNILFSFDGKDLLGTGGAIKKAFKKLSNPFVVIYGDVYFNLNFKKILYLFENFFFNDSLMIVHRNRRNYEKSNIQLLKKNKILYDKFNTNKKMKYIDHGISVFNKKSFKKTKKKFDLSELQSKLSYKRKLYGYITKKQSYEIGSLKGIQNLKKNIKK